MIHPHLDAASGFADMRLAEFWRDTRDFRFFITGGTGFFGTWLTETFLHACREHDLRAKMTILTRDERAFLARYPHLAGRTELEFVRGDVRSLRFPSGGFTHTTLRLA